MKISIKQISEATGFSPATISNALNHKKGVNKETSAAIFKAARDMGYITDSRISKIKVVIYKKKGSVIEDSPFFALVLDGAEAACNAAGLELIACYLDKRTSDYQDQLKWLTDDTTCGLILLGSELEEEDLVYYKNAKSPIVLIDYWCNDMSLNAIMSNNTDGIAQAVNYLIKKGHKQIGYLRGKLRIYPFRARGSSLRSALAQNDLPLQGKYIFSISSSMNGSYEDMCRYLKNSPELPTAFFSDNDVIAIGAMKALKEFGYRIPEDVSLIGFDDLPFCEIISPRLTTIHTVKKELGKMAVEKIVDMIKNKSEITSRTIISTTFMERESVKDLRCE